MGVGSNLKYVIFLCSFKHLHVERVRWVLIESLAHLMK